MAAVAAVLAQYSPRVVVRVCDPRTGLPSRCDWLPTVREVREACEAIVQSEAARDARSERERKQLDERLRLDLLDAQPRVDLAARHPPNWGLVEQQKSDAAHRAYITRLTDANESAFAAECKAAGVDPATASVSPTLAKLIAAKGPVS